MPRVRCDTGAAGILVTHEPRYAAYADRTVFLHDGRIVGSTADSDSDIDTHINMDLDNNSDPDDDESPLEASSDEELTP